MDRAPALLLALAVLAALVPHAPEAAAATLQVDVKNFAFVPQNASIAQGDALKWHWVSGTHNVREDGTNTVWCTTRSTGDCLRTFSAMGASGYHCSIHPGMKGKVFVGIAPAVVAILAPAGGATVWGRFDASGTAAHPSGIERVEVQLGPGDPAAAEGGTAWSAVVDSNPVPNGAQTLVARAFPLSGPAGEAALTVVVDNPPVTLEVVRPEAGPALGLVAASGSASHPFNPVTQVVWRLDGGAWADLDVAPAATGAKWGGLLDLTHVEAGEHLLEFQARDGYAPQDSAIAARSIFLLNPIPLPGL